jgi:hypothetical protein
MSLVLLAGISVVGCGEEGPTGPMKNLTLAISQVLKGQKTDFSDADLNSLASSWANLSAFMGSPDESVVIAFINEMEEAVADGDDPTTINAYTLLTNLEAAGAVKPWNDKSAADHWAEKVTAGEHPRSALNVCLMRGTVDGFKNAGYTIQMVVYDWAFRITNPNEVWVTIESTGLNFNVPDPVPGDADSADVPVAIVNIGDKIYVPPADEDGNPGVLILNQKVVVKTYDVLVWMSMAGRSTGYAFAMWPGVANNTVNWNLEATLNATSELGTVTKDYSLTYTPS